MKATGIVRRIDDLGRIVIPKEIRRTMRIREGDPLEIYTDREGEVIFKKYSPIGELVGVAQQYTDTLYKTCGLPVIICDRDNVIACAGVPKKDFIDRRLSTDADKAVENRSLYTFDRERGKIAPVDDSKEYFFSCMMPIMSEGDIIGCVGSVCTDGSTKTNERYGTELETKLIQATAGFLGRQLDS